MSDKITEPTAPISEERQLPAKDSLAKRSTYGIGKEIAKNVVGDVIDTYLGPLKYIYRTVNLFSKTTDKIVDKPTSFIQKSISQHKQASKTVNNITIQNSSLKERETDSSKEVIDSNKENTDRIVNSQTNNFKDLNKSIVEQTKQHKRGIVGTIIHLLIMRKIVKEISNVLHVTGINAKIKNAGKETWRRVRTGTVGEGLKEAASRANVKVRNFGINTAERVRTGTVKEGLKEAAIKAANVGKVSASYVAERASKTIPGRIVKRAANTKTGKRVTEEAIKAGKRSFEAARKARATAKYAASAVYDSPLGARVRNKVNVVPENIASARDRIKDRALSLKRDIPGVVTRARDRVSGIASRIPSGKLLVSKMGFSANNVTIIGKTVTLNAVSKSTKKQSVAKQKYVSSDSKEEIKQKRIERKLAAKKVKVEKVKKIKTASAAIPVVRHASINPVTTRPTKQPTVPKPEEKGIFGQIGDAAKGAAGAVVAGGLKKGYSAIKSKLFKSPLATAGEAAEGAAQTVKSPGFLRRGVQFLGSKKGLATAGIAGAAGLGNWLSSGLNTTKSFLGKGVTGAETAIDTAKSIGGKGIDAVKSGGGFIKGTVGKALTGLKMLTAGLDMKEGWETATEKYGDVDELGNKKEVSNTVKTASAANEGIKGYTGGIVDIGKLIGADKEKYDVGVTGQVLGGMAMAPLAASAAGLGGITAIPALGLGLAGAAGWGAGRLIDKQVTKSLGGKTMGETLYDKMHPKETEEDTSLVQRKDLQNKEKLQTAVSSLDDKIFEEKGKFFGPDKDKLKQLEDRQKAYKERLQLSSESKVDDSIPTKEIEGTTPEKAIDAKGNRIEALKTSLKEKAAKLKEAGLSEGTFKEGKLVDTVKDKLKDLAIPSLVATASAADIPNTVKDIPYVSPIVKEAPKAYKESVEEAKNQKILKLQREIYHGEVSLDLKDKIDLETKKAEVKDLQEKPISKEKSDSLIKEQIASLNKEKEELLNIPYSNIKKQDWMINRTVTEGLNAKDKEIAKLEAGMKEGKDFTDVKSSNKVSDIPSRSLYIEGFQKDYESLKSDKLKQLEESKADLIKNTADKDSAEYNEAIGDKNDEIRQLKEGNIRNSLIPLLEDKIEAKKKELAELSDTADEKEKKRLEDEIQRLSHDKKFVEAAKIDEVKHQIRADLSPNALPNVSPSSGPAAKQSIKKYESDFDDLKAGKVRKLEEQWSIDKLNADPNDKVAQESLNKRRTEIDAVQRQTNTKEALIPMMQDKISSKKQELAQYQDSGDTVKAEAASKEIGEMESKLAGVQQLSSTPSGFDKNTGQFTDARGKRNSALKDSLKSKSSKSKSTGEASPAYEGLGGLSKAEESGNLGSSAVNPDDVGGAAYGTYQMHSGKPGGKGGTVGQFINNSKWKKDFMDANGNPLKPGSKPYNDKWQEVANRGTKEDKQEFADAQHAEMQKTHYEPTAKKAKELGIDLENNPMLQDVMWSTGVQHGPGGGPAILEAAFKGTDPSKMDKEEIKQRVYDERGKTDQKGNLVHFSKLAERGLPAQQGVKDRFVREAKAATLLGKHDEERLAKSKQAEGQVQPATDVARLSSDQTSPDSSTNGEALNNYQLPGTTSMAGAYLDTSPVVPSWSSTSSGQGAFATAASSPSMPTVVGSETESTPTSLLKEFEAKRSVENQKTSEGLLQQIASAGTTPSSTPSYPTRAMETSNKSSGTETDPWDAGIAVISSGLMG